MFHKPFRVKSNTAIKGSDRRKLRTDVSILYPGLSDEDLSRLIPNKDEMSVMKIYTHAGQTAQVYCLQKTPVFFAVDRLIYPTVYTLWKQPDILPIFTTWPPVFTRLVGGADLMLPGVVIHGEVTPSSLGDLTKGQPCCVSLVGNRAAVAVGKTALSSSDMFDAGMKGRGVIILHTYQDHLWAHGERSEPPLFEDLRNQSLPMEMKEKLHIESISAIVDREQIPGVTNEQRGSSDGTDTDVDKKNEDLCINTENMAVSDEISTLQSEILQEENQLTVTPEEMDNLLYTCFMCALKTDVKKSDLPMLTSKFFKMLKEWCPGNKSIDAKKSSYKKFSKFTQTMEKKGLISLKALTPGVDSIVEVHRSCSELQSFEVPLKPNFSQELDSGCSTMEFQPPVILEMHTVVAPVAQLFETSGIRKGSTLTKVEVRQVITDYVKGNELQDSQNKGYVKLDPLLHDCASNKGEYLESLRWDDLNDRVLRKMGESYSVTYPGQNTIIKKGKLQPIKLDVAQRAGNKKVTLIENVEAFGIDPQELAHSVQIGVACSSSVVHLPGKGRGMQVQVQGNQIDYVAHLILEKYRIPRKFIDGLQKAAKSRKK